MTYNRWRNKYYRNNSNTIQYRKIFIECIKIIRLPTSFGVNLNNIIMENNTVSGLKSHDFYNISCIHILITIRGLMTPSVREAIYRLSRSVRWISTKSINTNGIQVMKDKFHVVMTLSQIQFSTSFI